MKLVLGVVAGLLLASCGSSSDPTVVAGQGDRPLVIATTDIWADVVRNVACGELAEVDVLIPSGADPHHYEPSLGDRAALGEASLIVANGYHLEGSLDDILDEVEAGGVNIFWFTDHVETIGRDPHVWWDPVSVEAALAPLGDALVESAGLDRAAVDACVESYSLELVAADADVAQTLADVPDEQRLLVTSHDSLGYFAERYNFEVLGAVIPSTSTMAEADPASMAALTTLVTDTGVKAIFTEPQHSSDDAIALAERAGDVKVVEIYTGTLGEAGSGLDTYTGFLRGNAEIIADALR